MGLNGPMLFPNTDTLPINETVSNKKALTVAVTLFLKLVLSNLRIMST